MKASYKYIIATLVCLILAIGSTNGHLGKVIIDTDAGADDAVAIFLTLRSESKDFKVIAITCSYGNTIVENVEQNVLKILTIANRTNIPVYVGASRPLIKPYKPSIYFGEDGLGDFNFTEKISVTANKDKHAAVALIEFVKKYPGEITILSLGPSTNVALAIALEPKFLKYVKQQVILGASVAGRGNTSPNTEFNFYQDPESNHMVLNGTTTNPCVLFPWEAALFTNITKDWRINVLGKINSTIVKFLNKAEAIYITKIDSWIVSDAMAAAAMIWPELITKSIVRNVSPVIDGAAKGSVLVDYSNQTGKPQNAIIIQEFNYTAFQEILLEKFS